MPVEPNTQDIALQNQFLNDIGYSVHRDRRFVFQSAEMDTPSNPQPVASTQEEPPIALRETGQKTTENVMAKAPLDFARIEYFREIFTEASKKYADKDKAEEDVLEEALRITTGDRQSQYGPPEQDFKRTAALWNALFGHKLSEPLEARDVAMAMICLKLSRETHQRKRDNSVDIAGYARLLHIVNQACP